jgi:DNA polymerase-4
MANRRWILHVDMDAFFAAVEQRDHPELRGKPVIIGADPQGGSGRGVVSTCSYEARKFGVHSAMPVSRAYRLCPNGIFVPPNGRLYREVSHAVFEIFNRFSDMVEPISVDEAFIDVTGSLALFGSAEKIARQIKQQIHDEQGITASVGIAPNKYLAKIASDLEKPDGLVIVDADAIDAFLAPLDIKRLWGAGEKTVERMRAAGINTIGDLARLSEDLLDKKFGKMGRHFYRLAHGLDERPVEGGHEAKSVSNEMTFGEDTFDTELIERTLFRLCEKVGYRLRQDNLRGRTIHLKLRYEGFDTITRNRTLDHNTNATQTIYEVVSELFHKNYQKSRKVRLLGAGVSGFDEKPGVQLSLFDQKKDDLSPIDLLEDQIKKRFGKDAAVRAESLGNKGKDREESDYS